MQLRPNTHTHTHIPRVIIVNSENMFCTSFSPFFQPSSRASGRLIFKSNRNNQQHVHFLSGVFSFGILAKFSAANSGRAGACTACAHADNRPRARYKGGKMDVGELVSTFCFCV